MCQNDPVYHGLAKYIVFDIPPVCDENQSMYKAAEWFYVYSAIPVEIKNNICQMLITLQNV